MKTNLHSKIKKHFHCLSFNQGVEDNKFLFNNDFTQSDMIDQSVSSFFTMIL